MKKFYPIIALLLISINSFAFDYELSSAVNRPRTNEVFVGGTFNTIIVFDISTGKTLRSFELPNGITDMQFNLEGQILLAISSAKAFLINPDDGSLVNTINGSAFQLFAFSPYFIDIKKYGDTKAIIYDSSNGEKIKEVRCDFQPKVCGFDQDFKALYILSAKTEIGEIDEKKFLSQKIEKTQIYNCYNSAYTAKQEDKNGSFLIKYDIEKATIVANYTCPFAFTGSFALAIIPVGENIYIADWDMLVQIDKNGISTAIECEKAGFAYANRHSPDFSQIIIASTKMGNIFNTTNGQWSPYDLRAGNEFTYTVSIFFINDKTWLLSKDYTLASMNKNGTKSTAWKINEGGEKGFSVYYTNGYSKKEDRDKEAFIINTELTKLGQQNIDLEQFIGKGDVVLGKFKTVIDAEAFIKTLKSNKLQYLTKIAPAK